MSCNDNDKNNPQHDVGQGVVVITGQLGFITFNYEAKKMTSTSPYAYVQFHNCGKVNALKEVVSLPPEEEWLKDPFMISDIKVGCGYIIRYRNETSEEYSYMRLYIKEYFNDQGIRGYWVQYEDNWIPQEF